jgi:hypothetical protein
LVVNRVEEGRGEVTVKGQRDMDDAALDFEEDTIPWHNSGLATLLAAAALCRIVIQDKKDFVDQEVVHGYGLEGGDFVEKMTKSETMMEVIGDHPYNIPSARHVEDRSG